MGRNIRKRVLEEGNSMSKKQITKDEAISKLWELGELSWILTDVQKVMKDNIVNDTSKISVILSSRRLGKSWLMCTMALEQCLKQPGSVVKYLFPKQKDAKRNIIPLFRQILESCPKSIRPVFMEADKCYRFYNGSEIQLAGSDNGGAESLRGGFSHLNIVDEAGFINQELDYIIRSILSPTTKTTGGRTIMISTPSKNENHSFIQQFVLPYQAENRIQIFTIHDNPNFSKEIIQEIIDEHPLREQDPNYRREYLCEVTRGSDKSILPSLTSEIEQAIVTDKYERPVFFDRYVSLDIGGSDLTAILLGYYDYLNATVVFEDELIFGKEVNTKGIAEALKEKEQELYSNPIDHSVLPAYLRVADNNNLILLTDLQRDHAINFIPTRKDNREAAINSLDVAISQKKVIINPKCKHLLYHMKFAEWNNTRTTFKKLKDSPSGMVKGGHCDALAAAIYFYRNVIKSKNPYPSNYNNINIGNTFDSRKTQEEAGPVADFLKKIFKK